MLPTAMRNNKAYSGKRASLRIETDGESVAVRGKSKTAQFMNSPIFVQRFPGSRFIELMRHQTGNPLSSELLTALIDEFLVLEDNHAVNVVLFGTNIDYGDTFSTGLCEKSLKLYRSRTLDHLYTLARLIGTYKRDFVSVAGCKMPGTVFGLLLNAKYRLGTPSLECSVDELVKGYIPGGGFTHHFSHKAGVAGLIMSRYLAYSRRTIQAADLYEMGILTHLVLENPHFMLCDALGHSIGSTSQAYQQLPAHQDALGLLLDTMHAGDDDGMEDPMKDPIWDKMMLVKPDEFKAEKFKHHPSDIENFYEEIAACFNAPSLEEAVRRVTDTAPQKLIPPAPFGAEKKLDSVDEYNWAAEALLSLEQCDPLAAKVWYKFTEISANPKFPLKDALKLEAHLNLGLMNKRIKRLAQLDRVDRGNDPSDRTAVKDSIAARLATVSTLEVDTLFENSPVKWLL